MLWVIGIVLPPIFLTHVSWFSLPLSHPLLHPPFFAVLHQRDRSVQVHVRGRQLPGHAGPQEAGGRDHGGCEQAFFLFFLAGTKLRDFSRELVSGPTLMQIPVIMFSFFCPVDCFVFAPLSPRRAMCEKLCHSLIVFCLHVIGDGRTHGAIIHTWKISGALVGASERKPNLPSWSLCLASPPTTPSAQTQASPPPMSLTLSQGSKLKGKARKEMLQKRERMAKNRQARSQVGQLVTCKRLSLTGRLLPGDRTAEVKAGPPVKYFGFARVRWWCRCC